MLRMTKEVIISSFILILSQNCFAISCLTDQDSAKDLAAVIKITQNSPLWSTYALSGSELGFVPVNGKDLLIFNISSAAVLSLGIPMLSCDESPKLFLLKNSNPPAPPVHSFGLFKPNSPGTSILGKLATATKWPILTFPLPLTTPDGLVAPEDFARLIIHEGFHMQYQFNSGFILPSSIPNLGFISDCLKIDSWSRAVETEYRTALELRTTLDGLSNEALKAILVPLIVARQRSLQDPESSQCWISTKFWERLEGSAYFFETQNAQAAGLYTPTNNDPSYKFPQVVSDTNPEFYYMTGNLYFYALKRLSSDRKWQKLVDEGASPSDLLTELIGTK